MDAIVTVPCSCEHRGLDGGGPEDRLDVLAGGVPTGAEGERKEAAQLTRRRRREQT